VPGLIRRTCRDLAVAQSLTWPDAVMRVCGWEGAYSRTVALKSDSAAAEFQKILDHPGAVLNEPIGALAHLGVARANALEARTSQGADADAARLRAVAAYKDFLAPWKDADPDIPMPEQVTAECAKMQWYPQNFTVGTEVCEGPLHHFLKATRGWWALPRALVPHLMRMTITQQVKLITLRAEDLVYAVAICTASVEIIGVRASSVVPALIQNASRILNEAWETHVRWPLRRC
jgi:hypothetical protein